MSESSDFTGKASCWTDDKHPAVYVAFLLVQDVDKTHALLSLSGESVVSMIRWCMRRSRTRNVGTVPIVVQERIAYKILFPIPMGEFTGHFAVGHANTHIYMRDA